MKNKKGLMILCILIIIFILIYVFADRKVINKNEKILNIVDKKVINKKDYGFLVNQNNKFILFNDDKTYTLFDRDLKEILKSEKEITLFEDVVTNKYYYSIDGELFDEDNNSIHKESGVVDNVDNNFAVFSSNKGNSNDYTVYDILNKKLYNNSNIMMYDNVYIEKKHYDNLYVIEQNKKVYYVYIDNNIKEYNNFNSTNNSATFYNDDNDKLVLSFYDENNSDKEKLTDYFYLDTTKECNQIKKYEDNSLVSDRCFKLINGYDITFDKSDKENFASVRSDEKDDTTIILLPNGEYKDIGHIGGSFSKDKYIYKESGENDSIVKIVNSDGKITESKCVGDLSLYGDKYICHDKYDAYILDEKFEKVSDYYDNISCEDSGYCIINNDSLKGIMYKEKVIIEPIYKDIILLKDKIIAEGIFGYDLYYLGEGKQIDKSELSENKIDIDIDVDKVITDYKLDDIKEIIENNKEDFKIYAYIVLNNDKLGDYKKYVLDYFKVYVDKIKYVKKEIFFNNLSKLKIIVQDKITEGAAGDYSDSLIRLTPEYKDRKNVIYHELMHFIDFEFNSNFSEPLYKYNDKTINKEEYRKLSVEEKVKVNYLNYSSSIHSYFMEGGAEYFSQYYFNSGITNTYEIPIKILHSLINLYGGEVDGVFFGNKGFNELLLRDITIEEYNNFDQHASEFTHDKTEVDYKDYIKLLDMIVNLYNKHNPNWINDNKLTFSIYSLLDIYLEDNHLKLSKNYNIYKSIRNKYEKLNNNYALETKDKDTYIGPHMVAYYNGYFYIYNQKYSLEKQKLILKYDHENNKYVKVN